MANRSIRRRCAWLGVRPADDNSESMTWPRCRAVQHSAGSGDPADE